MTCDLCGCPEDDAIRRYLGDEDEVLCRCGVVTEGISDEDLDFGFHIIQDDEDLEPEDLIASAWLAANDPSTHPHAPAPESEEDPFP